MSKVRHYMPEIESGHPIPERSQQAYTRKIEPGGLARLGAAMDVGQSVVIPVGSIGKLTKYLRDRGLEATAQATQDATEARVWAVARPKLDEPS